MWNNRPDGIGQPLMHALRLETAIQLPYGKVEPEAMFES
jgi:hypothetical protein